MIDLFSTRTMLAALEIMFIPRTFLLDTFFAGTPETSLTEYVDIDVIKGKRRLAPFVNPMLAGKVVDRSGYTTKTFKPPYIKPKMPTTAADLLKRLPGEINYGNKTPDQRAAQQLGKDMLELVQMIKRREEWMASQILSTGKVTVVGEGVNALIDFLMDANHLITLSGTGLWSDLANSDPILNLRTWRQLAGKDSGRTPNIAVFGQNVIQPFLLNDKVQKLLDKTKITLGQINVSQLPSGATYYGNIEGLDIYTYDEWYVDDAGVLQPMVPVDRVIMGSTQARAVRHYGAILDLDSPGITASVPYFPKSWREKDPSVQWLMLQSAPLPCMHEIDSVISAKVI